MLGRARCRSGSSTRERQLALTDSRGGAVERFPDVGSLKVRVGTEDVVDAHPFSDRANDGRDASTAVAHTPVRPPAARAES